ncbi:hypothetical protein, partial [Glaesserella parasuis]|uniref:hypothetical protein n=1 Tax=Glaesserella parasuis TaxID=738 RepID=UPI003F3F230A
MGFYDNFLSFEEFEEYGGQLSEQDFKKYLTPAATALDPVTSSYDPTGDEWPFRVRHYKQALTYQVTYFATLQATTAAELGRQPTSQSIGDTSVSYGSDGLKNKAGGVATI